MTAVLAVGPNPYALVDVSPDPSACSWGLQDISSSDSGRVHDANNTMYKMRTSQKRKLSLTWAMPTDAEVARILQAFDPEYFYVRYWDAMDGRFEVRQFYCGDRSAPLKWHFLPGKGTRYSTLSFNVVER